MKRSAADKPLKVGGQALADGVLMRTSRAWAIARADGTLEVGELGPNRAANIPVLRIILGLGGALRLAIARGMLRRGSSGAGVVQSKRLNKRFLWVMAGVEALTAIVQHVTSGVSLPAGLGLVPAFVAFAVTLAALRLATPAALWRYHGAEHKAVAAFEAGIDVSDIDAVLACPRVHDRCGTNLVFLMLVGGMSLMHLPALIQIPAFIVLLAAIAEVVSAAAGRPRMVFSRLLLVGGRALQRWVTTAEPTAAEQAVGCQALSAAVAAHRQMEAADGAAAAVGDRPVAALAA
jgi:uncharacterized protein YqhQ